MKIIKSLIILIYFFSQLMNAQNKEYLVTENNDTIHVSKIIHRKKTITVKQEKNKISFNDSLIKGYYKISFNSSGFYEKIHHPDGLPGTHLFLERIIDGRIKVYFEGYERIRNFYISKNNSKPILLPTGQFKFIKESTYEILKKFIDDDQQSIKELETMGTSYVDFQNLLKKYNSNFEHLDD